LIDSVRIHHELDGDRAISPERPGFVKEIETSDYGYCQATPFRHAHYRMMPSGALERNANIRRFNCWCGMHR